MSKLGIAKSRIYYNCIEFKHQRTKPKHEKLLSSAQEHIKQFLEAGVKEVKEIKEVD
jgi:hypothetical protein